MSAPEELIVVGDGPLATVHRLAALAVGWSTPATVVVSPLPVRAADVLDALGTGHPVLVDTPIAADAEDARRIEAADRAGLVVYGEHLAHAPIVRLALDHIRRMGPLRHVEVRSLSPAGAPHDPTVARARAIALALLLTDAEPIGVHAGVTAFDLEFEGGLVAHIEIGASDLGEVWDLQASSDTGVVRAELFPAGELDIDGDPVGLPPVPSDIDPRLVTLGHVDQMRAFASVTRGEQPLLGAAFGRLVAELVQRSRA